LNEAKFLKKHSEKQSILYAHKVKNKNEIGVIQDTIPFVMLLHNFSEKKTNAELGKY